MGDRRSSRLHTSRGVNEPPPPNPLPRKPLGGSRRWGVNVLFQSLAVMVKILAPPFRALFWAMKKFNLDKRISMKVGAGVVQAIHTAFHLRCLRCGGESFDSRTPARSLSHTLLYDRDGKDVSSSTFGARLVWRSCHQLSIPLLVDSCIYFHVGKNKLGRCTNVCGRSNTCVRFPSQRSSPTACVVDSHTSRRNLSPPPWDGFD